LDVDEVIAQLLVTEGFGSVEEAAFVDPAEIASIEGFDEGTAEEIQSRAREFLERKEAELDARRRELGVEDDLAQVQNMTTAMMVALGENEIKTLDDFADCATDDLCGWVERSKERGVEAIKHAGFLDGFDIGRQEAEEMILAARIILGWIKPEDLMEAVERDEDGNPIEADAAEASTDDMVALPEVADDATPVANK